MEGVGPSESLNLKKDSSKHLKWVDLEQVQHCANLPLQVTFLMRSEQRKTVLGEDERCRSSEEEEEE